MPSDRPYILRVQSVEASVADELDIVLERWGQRTPGQCRAGPQASKDRMSLATASWSFVSVRTVSAAAMADGCAFATA